MRELWEDSTDVFLKAWEEKNAIKQKKKYLDIVPSVQESELQEQAGMCQKCSSVNIFYRCKNFGALGLLSQIWKHFKQAVASLQWYWTVLTLRLVSYLCYKVCTSLVLKSIALKFGLQLLCFGDFHVCLHKARVLCRLQTSQGKSISDRSYGNMPISVALWEEQVLLGFISVKRIFSFLGILKEGTSYQAMVIKQKLLFKALRGKKCKWSDLLLRNSCIHCFDHSYLGPDL